MQNITTLANRTIFPQLLAHIKEKEATVLLGPRQVGKTTLMSELKTSLIKDDKIAESNIFSFNLDIFSDREIFESQEKFINFLRERSRDNFIYVFIDEAQRIKQAGTFIKGVYDLGLPVKLILSGSSSLEIRNEFGESLSGRKEIFTILPFTFSEFLDYKDAALRKSIAAISIFTAEEKYKIKSFFDEYLSFGGYPRIVVENDETKKKELLEEIYSSYIEKDIAGFLKIKEPFIFSNLVKLLAAQNGQLCNINHIAKELNINQRTVEKYIYYLEETFVIKKLRPFFTNAKKEIVKMPKVYFFDTGLRNLLVSNFQKIANRNDKGELLENFALNEIAGLVSVADKILFWRNKAGAEVDLVMRRGTEIIPVEIKYSSLNIKNLNSLVSFMDEYKCEKGYVAYLEGEEKNHASKNIIFVPIYKLYDAIV